MKKTQNIKRLRKFQRKQPTDKKNVKNYNKLKTPKKDVCR